jgi:glycosyltransferase involved in cell wall biosynthesis
MISQLPDATRLPDRRCVLHVTTVPQTLRFLLGHVAYAKRKGFEVHALSSPGELLDTFGQQAQVEIHSVPMPRRITPLRDLVALWRITRVMRKLRPTIVHGHTPKGGLLAMMAASLCKVPVRIYHMYGLPLLTATGLKRPILRWTERTACHLAHQVLCLSHSLREAAIAEGLCPAGKIQVLNHGNIDGVEAEVRFNPCRIPPGTAQMIRQRYHIPQDALVAGFVGRIVRDKGLIELVQAWQALREEFASLHLLIAGPFEAEDPIPADVENTLRTDPRIHLAGVVEDMPTLYRAIDVLVLPTYREGFGTVLLEAGAMELPVVATRIPGCIDAVREGETGLLVPARDSEALAAAIRVYLRDAELRCRHGLMGRERVLRDFNPEIMHETLCQEYFRLLRERGVVAERRLERSLIES